MSTELAERIALGDPFGRVARDLRVSLTEQRTSMVTAAEILPVAASAAGIGCLFANSETDLRTPLREGAADQELARVWCSAHLQKAAGHSIARPEFSRPQRTMSAIGG